MNAETPAVGKAQRIRDLKDAIQAQVMIKRVAISDATNPERVKREVERLRQRIEADSQEIGRLLARLEGWKHIVNQADARIEELQREIGALGAEPEVAKYERLLRELLEATLNN